VNFDTALAVVKRQKTGENVKMLMADSVTADFAIGFHCGSVH